MKPFLLLCAAMLPQLLFAQVNFSTTSFDNALKQSSAGGKLILLQFESADCSQCNEVADKGFEDKVIGEKINQTFFCLKIGSNHPDRARIASLYNLNVKQSFGTLFIDSKGQLVHTYPRTASIATEYAKQIDIALLKAGESNKIGELEAAYKNGNRSYGFLETLLQKRKVLNLPTDSLLDEYIDAVPADSLSTIRVLVFIANMAPVLESKADKILRKDQSNYNKAWGSIDYNTRVAINSAIISKSISKAIADKNESFALQTAAFAKSTHGSNINAGTKSYDANMIRYYGGVNDSVSYFKKTIEYYDQYYMSVSVESVKMQDSLMLQKMVMSAKKDTINEEDRLKIVSKVVYSPTVQKFSSDLNNAAYNFYRKTNDPYLLSVATKWTERALEFRRSASVMDTYSKLLYKQGQVDKAIAAESEAIVLQQKEGYPVKEFETTLGKMKSRQPVD